MGDVGDFSQFGTFSFVCSAFRSEAFESRHGHEPPSPKIGSFGPHVLEGAGSTF